MREIVNISFAEKEKATAVEESPKAGSGIKKTTLKRYERVMSLRSTPRSSSKLLMKGVLDDEMKLPPVL